MIVQLFDDVAIMKDLKKDIPALIHSTEAVPAIKKIISIHEIIDLNLTIEQNFKPFKDDPPWDLASIKDMNRTRIELLVFHLEDFIPKKTLFGFNEKIKSLFRIIHLRKPDAAPIIFD